MQHPDKGASTYNDGHYGNLCLLVAIAFMLTAGVAAMYQEYATAAYLTIGAVWMLICTGHEEKSSWSPLRDIQTSEA
jgi:hypothetical protein